jgi:flagellar basal-body rod protein FlgC
MGIGVNHSATDISASGMSAERFRMETVANNIANAFSTRTPGGGPYRRQDVVFSAMMNDAVKRPGRGVSPVLRGVEIVGIEEDQTEFPRVHNPGHPDADADGYVTMPNVNLPMEMINLITASRAYEANLRAAQAHKNMGDQAIGLLRA